MNRDLIKQFETLQSYFKKTGDKGRSIAYTRAVSLLRSVDHPITDVSQLKGVRGIGPQILAKVKEFLESGKIASAEEKRVELEVKVPLSERERGIEELSSVWGIGPVKADKLYDQGVKNIVELRKNTSLLTEQQKIGLKYHTDLLKKIPRLVITSINVIMFYFLNKKYGKGGYKLCIAGSYRRGSEESGDIDCLITSEKFSLSDVVTLFKKRGIITDVLSMRNEKFMGIAHCPGGGPFFRLDIEFVPKESWGSAQLYFTGSKNFNVYMRADAKRKGMLLNEHGLYDSLTKRLVLVSPSEEDIFRKVGLPFVPPERR